MGLFPLSAGLAGVPAYFYGMKHTPRQPEDKGKDAMLFDTHVHVDGLADAEGGLAGVLARASAAGVEGLLAVGGSPAGNRAALEAARAFPGRVLAAAGYNRDLAAEPGLSDEGLRALLAAPEIAALGEIGLDFHRGRETAAAQTALFERMLVLARASRKPVCVHMRGAEADILAALKAHAAGWPGPAERLGVMHCFTGDWPTARAALDLGFRISFSGILTFRNAGALREVAARVPEDCLLIETDAPYLAPEPFRGGPNEPARVRRVAEVLADIRRLPLAVVAEDTTRNAVRLFGAGTHPVRHESACPTP